MWQTTVVLFCLAGWFGYFPPRALRATFPLSGRMGLLQKAWVCAGIMTIVICVIGILATTGEHFFPSEKGPATQTESAISTNPGIDNESVVPLKQVRVLSRTELNRMLFIVVITEIVGALLIWRTLHIRAAELCVKKVEQAVEA